MVCQLPLELPHEVSLSRDDLVVSQSNRAAVAAIEAWPAWHHNVLLVVGPQGSGKSHLARVWADGAQAVAPGEDGEARALAQVEGFRALIDDVDRSVLSQEALFALVNAARLGRGWVLATARKRPLAMEGMLADLRSRLSAAALAMLDAPDDALVAGMLMKLFADRQLAIDPATLRYMAERIERSAGAAQSFVAAVDRAALSRKRRITRSLVREVLDEIGGEGA